jgi:hypothetical protein
MPALQVMVVTAETQVAQTAVVKRMMPLQMVASVLRNPVPAQAEQVLQLTAAIGMEAQVPEEPVVLASRPQAAALRQVVAGAGDITAPAEAARQFKLQLIKP